MSDEDFGNSKAQPPINLSNDDDDDDDNNTTTHGTENAVVLNVHQTEEEQSSPEEEQRLSMSRVPEIEVVQPSTQISSPSEYVSSAPSPPPATATALALQPQTPFQLEPTRNPTPRSSDMFSKLPEISSAIAPPLLHFGTSSAFTRFNQFQEDAHLSSDDIPESVRLHEAMMHHRSLLCHDASPKTLSRVKSFLKEDKTPEDPEGTAGVMRKERKEWASWWNKVLTELETHRDDQDGQLADLIRVLRKSESPVSRTVESTIAPRKLHSKHISLSSSRSFPKSASLFGSREEEESPSRKVSFSEMTNSTSVSAQPPSTCHSRPRRAGKKVLLEKSSSYRQFLRRSDRAGYRPPWRPYVDTSDTDKKMDKMLAELCDWMSQLHTPGLLDDFNMDHPTMSVDDVRKLFDINLESPAARCLAVNIRELSSIPNTLAKDTNTPQMEYIGRVRKMAWRDAQKEKQTKRTFAFGRSIQHGDPAYWNPPNNKTKDRWLPKHPHADLASMAEAFQSVAFLKVTTDFAEYLKAHNIPLPPCLQKMYSSSDPTKTRHFQSVGSTHSHSEAYLSSAHQNIIKG